MGVNPIPVNRAQGPEFWPNSGNSGFPNLSHSVPNGRVIKYPPKCALFPGRPRGAPGDPEIGGPGRPRNGPRKVGQRRVPGGPWDMDPAGGLQNPRGIPTWIDTHPQDPRGISSPPVGRHTARTRVGGGLAWCLATWSLNFVSWVVGMSLVSLHWGMVASHGAYSRNQLSVWVPGPIDRLVCFALRFFRRVYVAMLGTAT